MPDPKESPILFDIPDGSPPDQAFLEQLGHEVVVCNGPAHGTLCPILHGDCPKVDGAHGIVFELNLDRPQHRAILARYKETTRPDVPIRVVTTQEQALRYSELLKGLKVWTHQPAAGDLDGLAAEVEASDL
ncbi:MAG TPA: hypothetical protein VI980_07875 [Acidimicrobiia bacterium]|nr:hypothetical protein [Acidimicrobiia bacterium]